MSLAPSRVLHDALLIAGRNVRRLLKNAQVIIYSIIQPILQLILFAYIMGSLITFEGTVRYTDFVVPSVIVQTLSFVAMTTGIGIALDLQTGMVDRLRALPIARSAFLVGRLLSDSVRLAFITLVLVATALVIGFRFHSGALGALGMMGVVVVFGIVVTTFAGFVALAVRKVEAVSNALMTPLLPLVFTSSAFVPIDRLPGWLQPIARFNPFTAAIDTARGLALGEAALRRVSDISLEASALRFGLWSTGLIVVCSALAVRNYRLH